MCGFKVAGMVTKYNHIIKVIDSCDNFIQLGHTLTWMLAIINKDSKLKDLQQVLLKYINRKADSLEMKIYGKVL